MGSEKEYRTIFEKSPLGIMYFDREGVVTLCNERSSRIFGKDKSDIIGSDVLSFFNAEQVGSVIEKVLSGESVTYEDESLTGPKDLPVQVEVHCSPDMSEDGSILGGICMIEDITQRKDLEETLKLDESRLEVLLELEQMMDAPMQEIADFVHEEAVRLTGSTIGYLAFLNEDESTLTMHTWSNSVMKECTVPDRKFVYDVKKIGLWGEPIRQRKPVMISNYEMPHPLKRGYPEGHVELTNYMAVPVFEGSRIVATAGVGNKDGEYDASDVRQLTLLMQGLWRLIQRRESIDALKKYAEDLEHSNELKELFSDIMRHDLLNPAGIVKGYAELLLEMEDDEKKQEMVRTIDRNNKKLIDMIENAARFAKLDTFEDIEFQEMDLALVIESVIGNFRPNIDERQMNVEFDPKGSYPAKVNPMVEDVFSNLLSNAIKYSPDKEWILISIFDAGDEWKVSVTDRGEGVPDENKPELFERFKRVTKKGIKGTGLGLAIVKKIIDLHGGSVGVEDNPEGQGSIFWITLRKWG
ncbi:GAF domain-containing protein [Methanococcoides methylutens]|uniref:histidine kinase n=1 Tax=Methanococcoides methylutens MM1 TaxID=1434104 RepID=A0A0E3X0T4_METMT|nr:GAF domain-containing protein [Methanococcoides methylutens]AKB85515.1 sensory transduction histidine kinase [Methanococcoides methylutens MM1]